MLNSVRASIGAVTHRTLYTVWSTASRIIPQQRQGALCVLTVGERVLLARHTYGDDCWQLVGGLCHRNEEALATAGRECQHELGTAATNLTPVGQRVVNSGRVATTISYFAGEVDPARIKLCTSEIKEYRLFKRSALPSNVTPGVLVGLELTQ